MSPRLRAALPALAAVLLLAAEAAACPNCKNTVKATSDAGVGDPALGFAVSIYAMLGSVLGLAGFVGWKIVRAVRRSEGSAVDPSIRPVGSSNLREPGATN